MRNPPPNVRLLHALHDAAHSEAEALRRKARDDFWRGADALLGTAATAAQRASVRLQHRLRRRASGAGFADSGQRAATCSNCGAVRLGQ